MMQVLLYAFLTCVWKINSFPSTLVDALYENYIIEHPLNIAIFLVVQEFEAF